MINRGDDHANRPIYYGLTPADRDRFLQLHEERAMERKLAKAAQDAALLVALQAIARRRR